MPRRRAAKHKSLGSRSAFRLCGESLEYRRLLAFDPSGVEQAYVESLNRVRLDPQAELNVLFSDLDPLVARQSNVQSAMDFFNVSDSLLLSQWSQLTAVGPLAWNENLYDAAGKHNLAMQREDVQEHQVPNEDPLGQRITAEGYEWTRVNENIYAFSADHIHGHAGFLIDWGDEPGGIQNPPGHRNTIMDGRLTDVGVDVLADSDPSTDVGPFLVTQDFGQPRTAGNPFMLGVTWQDSNSNAIYDPGEGIGNVSITVSGSNGTFTTQSMTAGGYQVRVPNGTYQIVAAGGPFGAGRVVSNITVSGEHRKVDFQPTVGGLPPIANPDTFGTSEGVSASHNVIANDRYPDGTVVTGTVNVTTAPTQGTITNIAPNGQVTYQPNDGFFGTDTFRYSVIDNQAVVSNITTVTISVLGTNDAPTAQSFSVSTVQDELAVIPLSSRVADADGSINWNTLEVTQPAQGTAVADGPGQSVRYTPPAGFTGTAQFTYRVADNENTLSDFATITVNVADANDVPTASADIFATAMDESKVLGVLTNDMDGDGDIGNATVVIVAQPQSGQAVANSNAVLYTPPAQFVGAESFTYYVVDPTGARSNTTSVTVYVTAPDSRWQNPVNARDVSGDGVVAAQDVIQVLNRIGTDLSNTPFLPPPLADVDGSGVVAPTDAVIVINGLINGGQNAPLSGFASQDIIAELVSSADDSGMESPAWGFRGDVESDDVESDDVESDDVESDDVESDDVESDDLEDVELSTERVDAAFAAPLEDRISRIRRTARTPVRDLFRLVHPDWDQV